MLNVEWISCVGLFFGWSLSFAQANDPGKLPFRPTWTRGTCPACKIAQWIDEIQFTAPGHAWASGCRTSMLGNSALFGQQPYCTVVGTADAGRTWKEVSGIENYPGPPEFSFVDSNHGWISWTEGMIRTSDGGQRWEKLRDDATGLSNLVFLNERLGVGTSKSCCASDKAVRTTDGGREWAEAAVPQAKEIDRIFFLNREAGWMAATVDRHDKSVVILATSDAGVHWSRRGSLAVQQNCRDPYVPFYDVQSLAFQDLNRGWLRLSLSSLSEAEAGPECEGQRLYRTTDGGKTWALAMHTHRDVTGFGFLKNGTVFAFIEGTTEHLYSTDGGGHWRSFRLPPPAGQKSPPDVHDCHEVDGDLMCSASYAYYTLDAEPGIFLLRLREAANAGH